jgi:hypothetical protein
VLYVCGVKKCLKMKKEINSLLLRMQSGDDCIGDTSNKLMLLFHRNELPKYTDSIVDYKIIQHELDVTNSLLQERQRVLDAIPECKVHGACVPHAIDWINEMKEKYDNDLACKSSNVYIVKPPYDNGVVIKSVGEGKAVRIIGLTASNELVYEIVTLDK